MFTEPEIVQSANLTSRAYVKFYIDGKRYRFYNGKLLGINCNPNKAKTPKDRDKALNTLLYNLRKKLDAGWRPDHNPVENNLQQKIYTVSALRLILKEILSEDLSSTYIRDIKSVGQAFIEFLQQNNYNRLLLHQLQSTHIDSFLIQFGKSATYYMNKRRTLGGIFFRLVSKKLLSTNPVHQCKKQKEKSTLHDIYTPEKLTCVLKYLQKHHLNLYLCGLLMYGCFLRPHREIRMLRWSSFKPDFTTIAIGGSGNKSKKIRTVHVPEYVRQVILNRYNSSADRGSLVFNTGENGLNESYFNTAFTRIKEKLVKDGVLTFNHTLYSFRHTAAVNLYMKTKDVYKVQQAMGHSNMQVTLTYLRSLGVINALDRTDLPDNPLNDILQN